jgi:hypothetical protein
LESVVCTGLWNGLSNVHGLPTDATKLYQQFVVGGREILVVKFYLKSIDLI